jgi:predicted kinase
VTDRPTLHLTQGLPAAGKTTAARKLIANSVRPLRYIGLDALRLMLDGQTPTAWWAPGAEQLTSRAQAALAAQLLADGSDVIIDGTHVHPGQVADLRRALAGQPIHVIVHRIDTSVDDCIRRDHNRTHPIGEPCIRQLADQWAATEAGGWQLAADWITGEMS